MIGVWANAIAVLIGGAAGLILRGGLPEKMGRAVNQALGMCVLVIGIMGAIETKNVMLVILSLAIGTVLGELLAIENRLDRLGDWVQSKFANSQGGISQGFVSATLLFCVGSMAIVGSMEAGISNKADTLLAKSALDGVSALIFASTLGPGVLLSAIPLTIYQGGIALLASLFGSFLSDSAVLEMSAAGSILIMGLGFNMLGMGEKRIPVGNMLPGVLLPAIYITIRGILG